MYKKMEWFLHGRFFILCNQTVLSTTMYVKDREKGRWLKIHRDATEAAAVALILGACFYYSLAIVAWFLAWTVLAGVVFVVEEIEHYVAYVKAMPTIVNDVTNVY